MSAKTSASVLPLPQSLAQGCQEQLIGLMVTQMRIELLILFKEGSAEVIWVPKTPWGVSVTRAGL